MGQVTEARAPWALEIFWRNIAKKLADEPRYGAVRINPDEGAATQRQEASDRSGEADELLDIPAVDHLHTGYHGFDRV